MVNKVALLAAMVLMSMPVYAGWKLQYETDFSTNPKWETNNPTNYYWDNGTKSFYLKVSPGSSSYVTIKIPWNDNGIKTEFDLRIMSVQSYGNINFGFMDENRNHKGPNVLYALYGIDIAQHIQFRAILDPTNPHVRGIYYNYGSGKWYHHNLEYKNDTKTSILEIWDSDSKVITNMSIKGVPLPKMENLGTSIIGFSGGLTSTAYLDNVKYYTWEDGGAKKLAINVTAAEAGANFTLWFNATLDGKPVGNLTAANVKAFVEGNEIKSFSLAGNSSYAIRFGRPKVVGNLNISLMLNYSGETASSSVMLAHKTSHRENILITTNGSFWDNLYASVLGYPVLQATDERMQLNYFVGRYKPNEIFALGGAPGSFNVTDRDFLREQFPGNGTVIIDSNREKALLGATIATILNYRLTNKTASGSVICTFICNITNATVLDSSEKLENRIISLVNETDYLLLANANINISGLAPRLAGKRNAIMLAFSYSVNGLNKSQFYPIREKINRTAEKIKDSGKLSKNYLFDTVIYIGLFGMPYGVIEDPAPEWYNNIDGNMIYTDNFYGDIDNDPYQDAAVGRFASSLQIENIDYWNPGKKDVLIIAEYRVPKVADLVMTCGMIEGFAADYTLDLFGFDVKRIVESRGAELTENLLTVIAGQDELLSFSKEDWEEDTLKFIEHANKVVRYGSEIKYALLEHDLEKSIRKIKPQKLSELTRSVALGSLNGRNIVFFFGVGNASEWIMPKDKLNPYPDDAPKINAKELDFKEPVFLFDEHSLSGHPDSSFVKASNTILIGSTGIVHSPAAAMPLLPFLMKITENKPVGYALKEAKNIVVFPEKNESIGNMITGSTTTGALMKSLKEHYLKILYGDPKIVIDPVLNYRSENYPVDDDMSVKISMVFNSSIDNGSIAFETPDTYIMEYNKPVLPLHKISIPLPSNITILALEKAEAWKRYDNVKIPLAEPDEHYSKEPFNGTFPEQPVWASLDRMLDGRAMLDISIVPVKYYNTTTSYAYALQSLNITLKYDAPLEILDITSDIWWNVARFNVRLKGYGKTNVTVKIGEELVTKEAYLNGIENVTIYWKGKSGEYPASVIAANKNIAGPKTVVFELRDFVGKIKNITSPGSIGYELSTFESGVKYYIGNETVIEYYDPVVYTKLKKSSHGDEKEIVTNEGRLLAKLNATTADYLLLTPKGWFIRTIENGTASERVFGDAIVLERISRTLKKAGEEAEAKISLILPFIIQ